MTREIFIDHEDGRNRDPFNMEKVILAAGKSAKRVNAAYDLSVQGRLTSEVARLVRIEADKQSGTEIVIPVSLMHTLVECALDEVDPNIAKSYRDFRNYKQDFVRILDKVYAASNEMRYSGDRNNANQDTAYVSTRRAKEEEYLSKELYQMFFLTELERLSAEEGYLYVHDMSARRDTFNCCLFRLEEVMKGGFEMGNIHYNEPKSLLVAWEVGGDIVFMCGGQQYGGFTVPDIDTTMAYYAEKTFSAEYQKELEKYLSLGVDIERAESAASEAAYAEVERQMRQGYQSWEMKFNTVASSRGDFPFITVSCGLDTSRFGKLCTKTIMEVHRKGQGEKGKEVPVLFPKIVFLYTEDLHGDGKAEEGLFDEAIKTSSKTMYPDYLSLDGDTHVAEIYHKYGVAVSPMGCRAFLTPWYERGGMEPDGEDDPIVIKGRANIGVITMNPPMIVEKAKRENKDWREVLEYYMQQARDIHIRTKNYLGNMKASMNPLGFCEGGFYGGHLSLDDKIAPVIESWTATFGFTGLNEAQKLYDGRSYRQAAQDYIDGKCESYFALDFVKAMYDFCEKYKWIDKIPYAVYATPAESLCGLQVKQFLKKYGPNPAVTDKGFTTNGFHCDVREDITPTEKQDLEEPCWKYVKGGRIQYVKYQFGYNTKAIKSLVRRAMEKGYYEGVNLSLSFCNDCGGKAQDGADVCPCCGSYNLTKIDRMNGYLSYSRVHGKTRLNDAKMEEISVRKSM